VAARAKVGPNRSIAITLSLTASRNRTSRARPFRASNQNSQVTQGNRIWNHRVNSFVVVG
jgi:hypothetical protein